jgi:hypothetical protein
VTKVAAPVAAAEQFVAPRSRERALRSQKKRWAYVGRSEVVAFEEQGKVARLGERVGRAVDDVELRLVALPLA